MVFHTYIYSTLTAIVMSTIALLFYMKNENNCLDPMSLNICSVKYIYVGYIQTMLIVQALLVNLITV